MSEPFLNGWTFSRSANTSPASFSVLTDVVSLSGIGKTNPLVDVTSFDSAAREYIAGLADGNEVTMEVNYIVGNTVHEAIRTDVNNGSNFIFRAVVSDGESPENAETYEFTATALSWEVMPSFDDKNMRAFTFKISGDITVS
jgi:hypothetical protein